MPARPTQRPPIQADLIPRRLVRESGSAYLVTLLLLIVLTLLGLSLALVTGTESQIGANERVLERVFYAADAGIGVGAARILAGSDYQYDVDNDLNNSYIMNETPNAPVMLTRSRVSIGPMVPLQTAPCNLCEINNSGSYRSNAYERVNILIPSRGTRQILAEAEARRQVAATLDIQPWQSPTRAAFPFEFLSLAELAEKATL